MIRPSQSGWLADELTPTALATTIDAALAEVREGIDLSPTCRNIAETEYNATTQAGRYLKLFAALQSNPTPNQLRESTHPTS
jgi:hypothetical protein